MSNDLILLVLYLANGHLLKTSILLPMSCFFASSFSLCLPCLPELLAWPACLLTSTSLAIHQERESGLVCRMRPNITDVESCHEIL